MPSQLIVLLLAIVGLLIWLVSTGRLALPGNSGHISGELLKAVNGDRKLAQRLLDQTRNKYPGKSDRWYVEKVIYDIYRDRGEYEPDLAGFSNDSCHNRQRSARLKKVSHRTVTKRNGYCRVLAAKYWTLVFSTHQPSFIAATTGGGKGHCHH